MTVAWLRDLEERVHETSDRLLKLRGEHQQLRQQNEELELESQQLRAENEGLTKERQELGSTVERLEAETKRLEATAEELTGEKNRLSQQIIELEKTPAATEDESSWAAERDEIRQRVGSLVEHLEGLLAD